MKFVSKLSPSLISEINLSQWDQQITIEISKAKIKQSLICIGLKNWSSLSFKNIYYICAIHANLKRERYIFLSAAIWKVMKVM